MVCVAVLEQKPHLLVNLPSSVQVGLRSISHAPNTWSQSEPDLAVAAASPSETEPQETRPPNNTTIKGINKHSFFIISKNCPFAVAQNAGVEKSQVIP